jgi:4-amino-4-deoxy-L-arabinose transferase-like glycosyltransferase
MKKNWLKRIALISIVIWVAVGIYGLIFNISYVDEAKYLIKGRLILIGEIEYYLTENFIYQHMPGSLLWFGLGQKLFGPNLLVGRIQSFLTGLLVLLSSYLLGKRLGGKKGGVLSLALLSLAPVMVLDYSASVPQSLVVLMLLIGFIYLYDGLVKKHEMRFLLASIFFSLAFIVRENFLFTLILYIGLLVIVYKKNLKQLIKHVGVILITLGIFIVPGYPGTIEVLRNFPGISHLLPIAFAEREVLSLYWKEGLQTPGLHFRAIKEFGEVFNAWVLIWGLIFYNIIKKKLWKAWKIKTPLEIFMTFLIGVTVFNFVIHSWAAFKLSPRAIITYFSYVTPLVAVIMATLIAPRIKKVQKNTLVVYLGFLILGLVGVRFARIFALPTRHPSLRIINESVKKIEPLVNNKDKIIWLTEPIGLYLTGRVSYYPLIHHTGFFKPSIDTKAVRRLGFWNQEMIKEWLLEADLVVIGDNKMNLLKQAPKVKYLADFIEAELEANFELIEKRDDMWPKGLSFYQPLTEK